MVKILSHTFWTCSEYTDRSNGTKESLEEPLGWNEPSSTTGSFTKRNDVNATLMESDPGEANKMNNNSNKATLMTKVIVLVITTIADQTLYTAGTVPVYPFEVHEQ